MHRGWLAKGALCVLLLGTTATAPAYAKPKHHPHPFRLAAAGDISCRPGELGAPPDGQPGPPDNCQQAGTASLIESLNPNAVATPGDIQYDRGSLAEFSASFAPTWGAFKSKIYPAPGNHEWYDQPVNGGGYFDYFNGLGVFDGRAGPRGKGYYSVNLNHYWHLITLNSNCNSDDPSLKSPVSCTRGSAQELWLRHDLHKHRHMCIIAQWHHPYFTSGATQFGLNNVATLPFWQDLYKAGATLILNGHDHDYERLAPQSDTGHRDKRHGVRAFVVGTGGKSLFAAGGHQAPNSQVYNNRTFGVTLFTLRPHSYSWRFYREPVAGNGTFSDHGSAGCSTRKSK